ncbi:MAG: hypothetical protein APR54_02160 [Candidatus Cloacimonas sp. SDB]|nr:MAG: hypothetical protein APR54_02160 [Candidatus Cloacimonas sp. SDB]
MEIKENILKHIESLKKIALALSAEKDLNEFFKLVLAEAMRFTKADAGTVYALSDDETKLDFKIVCTISKNIQLGIADVKKWPSVTLFHKDNSKNLNNFVTYVFHSGKAMNIADVYEQELFDNAGTKNYDKVNNYRSQSMLAIPLKNHEDKVLGVLQLINAMGNNKITTFNQEHVITVSSLASQAAIALTNRKLISELENLLDQFIKAIAVTIDKKSKYTGGHISRVAEITRDLAEEIQKDKGTFSEIDFSEDELKELQYASWMHDLGKITTPSHIMDKSSRLENIIDCIKFVEMRYLFIKDILLNELNYKDLESEKQEIVKLLRKLDSDWKFIKKINKEENQIKAQDISRIEDIYSFIYTISNKEYRLLNSEEKEHLQIPIGTLSPEQSEIMKEHVLVTHNILSKLNFPAKYKNVPFYAATHHENLNGSGYPFHLKAEKLPLKSRIIAISDIFESLTAQDRPYKTGKTLSITLTILANKVKNKEIDSRLMDLILDTGYYLKYAKKFLSPQQIDGININEIKKIYKTNGNNL